MKIKINDFFLKKETKQKINTIKNAMLLKTDNSALLKVF